MLRRKLLAAFVAALLSLFAAACETSPEDVEQEVEEGVEDAEQELENGDEG